MSTHSTLIIKLKENDRNIDLQSPNGGVINPKGKQYLAVYCHFDGYISGVGFDLLKRKFNYDECLSFILMGDRSTVDECYVDKGESWDEDKPRAVNSPYDHEYYTYLFQNNKWYLVNGEGDFVDVKKCNKND